VALAQLCDGLVKSSEDTVAKAPEGDYREEHVFTLKQSLGSVRYYQRLIAEVDKEIASRLQALETSPEAEAAPPTRTKKRHYQRQHYEPTSFDLRGELYRIFGVDLTEVPAISAVTAHTILCEVGPHLSAIRNASAFASWLGLCPEKQISGGKVLFTKSRRVRRRFALALRLAANSLHHADNYLGEFFRRMATKLGKPPAITATDHK
jgi:transposase